jgi:DNA polymerase III epsilon subunit-like protein
MKCQVSSENDYKIVYFDIETSGLEITYEILQIAAILEDCKFSVYVLPTTSISHNASKINGLHCVAGELYFHNKKVNALPLFDALSSFAQFLDMLFSSCFLAAYNARFDVPRLIEAITNNKLTDAFHGIIGFSDTLQFKKRTSPSKILPR